MLYELNGCSRGFGISSDCCRVHFLVSNCLLKLIGLTSSGCWALCSASSKTYQRFLVSVALQDDLRAEHHINSLFDFRGWQYHLISNCKFLSQVLRHDPICLFRL